MPCILLSLLRWVPASGISSCPSCDGSPPRVYPAGGACAGGAGLGAGGGNDPHPPPSACPEAGDERGRAGVPGGHSAQERGGRVHEGAPIAQGEREYAHSGNRS
eukprot:3563101-Pyramimonas_sp.AAC.1